MEYSKILDCDLCVLGGGGAGLVAAARAATLTDKKIIVLEKGRPPAAEPARREISGSTAASGRRTGAYMTIWPKTFASVWTKPIGSWIGSWC